MNKIEDEAYNLIKEMMLNNFQWSTERGQSKRVGGKLEVDALTLLSAKVDAMTQRLNRMNVNVVNSSAPPPCEICGFVDHLTLNCQVGSLFSQNINEVHYVNNFNPRPTNEPYSNTYNPGCRNQPNYSYRPNPNPPNFLQMNARPPPGFHRPPFPQQAPPKSNLEAMMESMLLVQQKQDEYMKQLAYKVDVLSSHNKMLEAQIAQQASSSSTPPGRLPSKPEPNHR